MQAHLYERRYEVVTYPDGEGWAEGWGGFSARILVNPSGSELRHEDKLYEDSNGKDLDAQDEYWKYIAPRIPEWNLTIRDASGAVVDVPPPAENWASFLAVEFAVMIWLRICIHTAHMPESLGKLQGKGDKPSLNGAGSTDSIPPTPLLRKNSSKRVATSSMA